MYDIIYSVIFHQELDYVNHYIKNVEKYNKNNKFLIVLHLSDILYELRDKLYLKNSIVNTTYYNKASYTHLILKATMENLNFIISNNIEFKYFMPLSSSLRFVKQAINFSENIVNKQEIENKISQTYDELNKNIHVVNWGKNILKNRKIMDILKEKKIPVSIRAFSGIVYPKNLIIKIHNFIYDNDIFNLIECEIPFEEFLLQSLSKYYGYLLPSYCHIFWGKKESIPSVKEAIEILKSKKEIFILKRFSIDLNDELYNAIENNLFDI